ncbi:MAG: hypothetical protein AAGC70_13685 [Pseudomonadota bacterium]
MVKSSPRIASAIILVALVVLHGTATAAEEVDGFYVRKNGKMTYFGTEPATKLMHRDEYADYMTYLRNLKCARGLAILRLAFMRRYPQYREVLKYGQRYISLPARWSGYATAMFPEYSFCNSLLNLKYANARISETGKKPPYYVPGAFFFVFSAKPQTPARLRDEAIHDLLLDVTGDYPPAYAKLIKLMQQGDIFNPQYTPPYIELYLQYRYCDFLKADCDEDRRSRIKALEAKFRKSIVEKMKVEALYPISHALWHFNKRGPIMYRNVFPAK